eukprot:TRINITY_DN11227_c0_g1_i1.p1 TRINITY_DN11227_c0_g1~~TRINITY_DN11227_c0_g1_i1.p1  ORF type:complete len:682 (+),score=110.83 TRINITY_DN11227_c0_g1_i1:27-2072(+)
MACADVPFDGTAQERAINALKRRFRERKAARDRVWEELGGKEVAVRNAQLRFLQRRRAQEAAARRIQQIFRRTCGSHTSVPTISRDEQEAIARLRRIFRERAINDLKRRFRERRASREPTAPSPGTPGAEGKRQRRAAQLVRAEADLEEAVRCIQQRYRMRKQESTGSVCSSCGAQRLEKALRRVEAHLQSSSVHAALYSTDPAPLSVAPDVEDAVHCIRSHVRWRRADEEAAARRIQRLFRRQRATADQSREQLDVTTEVDDPQNADGLSPLLALGEQLEIGEFDTMAEGVRKLKRLFRERAVNDLIHHYRSWRRDRDDAARVIQRNFRSRQQATDRRQQEIERLEDAVCSLQHQLRHGHTVDGGDVQDAVDCIQSLLVDPLLDEQKGIELVRRVFHEQAINRLKHRFRARRDNAKRKEKAWQLLQRILFARGPSRAARRCAFFVPCHLRREIRFEQFCYALQDSCLLHQVTPETIEQGILTIGRFHTLIIPGGVAREFNVALQGPRMAAVSKFVHSGGGFVGVCAGAFLAAADGFDGAVSGSVLIGAEARMVAGRGGAAVRLTSKGCEVLGGTTQELSMFFSNGPLLTPAVRHNRLYDSFLPQAQVLASYERVVTTTCKLETPEAAAIVASNFGEGRVIIFGPHPEVSGGGVFNSMVRNAVFWSCASEVDTDSSTADEA